MARSIDICANQLTVLPEHGQWTWNTVSKCLAYSDRNGFVRTEMKPKKEKHLKIDIRTGSTRYRQQRRPFQPIGTGQNGDRITLHDTIQASLNVMSEIFYIPIEFEEYIRMSEVQDYLLHLLNYFYWFIEMETYATPLEKYQIDRSNAEKRRIRLSYAHALAALDVLKCKYADLLVGKNLKDFHHMRSGDLFYSCSNIDQTIFESLSIFSVYFIWITFSRRYFFQIRKELARLFRMNNPMNVIQIPSTDIADDELTTLKYPSSSISNPWADCFALLSNRLNEKMNLSPCTDSVKINTIGLNTQQQRLISMLKNDESKQDLLENGEHVEFINLQEKSPLHRQKRDRIRGRILRELKTRHHSLTDDQAFRLKDPKQFELQRTPKKINIARNSFGRGKFTILPEPTNPIDQSAKNNESRSKLPKVKFQLNENIGIIGENSTNFDSFRLIRKSSLTNKINLPSEYSLSLSELDETIENTVNATLMN